LHKYEEVLRQKTKPYFLWKLEFSRVFRENGGFDVVIGNPPYLGEEGNKSIFQQIASTAFGKKYYVGKMDLWYFFTSKAIDLVRTNGVVSFIAPNNWMTTAGGRNMRKHIISDTIIDQFITFNNIMVFESASQQTMIFLLHKEKTEGKYQISYSELTNILNGENSSEISNYLNSRSIGNHYEVAFDPMKHTDGSIIQFLNNNVTQVITKIKSNDVIYLISKEILNGIHPHHANVTKKMLPLLSNSTVGDGIFVLSNKNIEELELSEQESGLLKPCYDSRNIGRYYFNPQHIQGIIYTTSDFKDVRRMEDYPLLKTHLDKYKNVITSDNKPYGLHRARQQDFFEMPKIVSLRKCKVPTFMYIDKPSYVMAEYYIIKTGRVDMKYLLGLLNSKLVAFWLLKMGKIQGNIYQVDKEPLMTIPIKIPNNSIVSTITQLVEKIIAAKDSDSIADTSILEAEIDRLVYELYGLTEDEIKIVEKSVR